MYLRNTIYTSLYFSGMRTPLLGYVDSDLVGDTDHRKSTTGYMYTLGGTTVSWISQLNKVVAGIHCND